MNQVTAPGRTGRGNFRIESDCGMRSRYWASNSSREILVHDRSLAVALAAKSLGATCGGEIRVVYAPTGEVVFRKQN